MGTSISSIVQKISRTSAAVGLSFTLLGGGGAFAETVEQRIQAEMNQGKDYVAARDAAARGIGSYAPADLVTKAQKALDQMQHGGLDYVAAHHAPVTDIPAIFADKQIQTEAGLESGKDLVAARDAADKAPPAAVRFAGTVRAAQ